MPTEQEIEHVLNNDPHITLPPDYPHIDQLRRGLNVTAVQHDAGKGLQWIIYGEDVQAILERLDPKTWSAEHAVGDA